MSYDPHSNDAMFSRVMQRLDSQDRTLNEILAEVKKTNGRVSSLETDREVMRSKTSMIAAGVSAVVGIVSWLAGIVWG